MATIQIKNLEPDSLVANSLRKQIHDLLGRVRHRAYHLFESRGGQGGNELDDWRRAEEELFVPIKSEVKSIEDGYQLVLSIPAFEPFNLDIYITDNTLIVKGEKSKSSTQPTEYSEEGQSVFYQWPIPAGALMGEITAEWKDEELTITVPTRAVVKRQRAAA